MPAAVAVPAAIAAIGAAGTIGTGLAQSSSAKKQANAIQSQIDNYQRQTLTNPYENIQVSTLGTDRQREDLARAMTTYANLAAMGGGQTLASLAPAMLAQQNQQDQQITANLDQQEAQRQQLIAQGYSQVQNQKEVRERDDMLGLGNALNVANQNRANGINTITQGFAGLAQAGIGGLFNKSGTSAGSQNGSGYQTNAYQNTNNVWGITTPQLNVGSTLNTTWNTPFLNPSTQFGGLTLPAHLFA